jgi:ribose transport system permease protein
MTSVISAKVMVALAIISPDRAALAIWEGFFVALCAGLVTGMINVFGVAILKVNVFIVTLVTASIFQRVTLVISNGVQVFGLSRPFVYEIESGRTWSIIPTSALLALPAIAAIHIAINHVRYGRYLFAIGSNAKVAIVAGIRVNLNLIGVYVACSVITAFAGWLLTARVSSGEPLLGGEFSLSSIAAAFTGGCLLCGGEGLVMGVFLGVIFIAVLGNGMDLMRIGSNYQIILLGVVLVGAVVLDRYRSSHTLS